MCFQQHNVILPGFLDFKAPFFAFKLIITKSVNVRVDKEVFGLKGNLSHSQFQCSPKKMFCDLIHSEDTFIVRNVGRWSPFENEAKGT